MWTAPPRFDANTPPGRSLASGARTRLRALALTGRRLALAVRFGAQVPPFLVSRAESIAALLVNPKSASWKRTRARSARRAGITRSSLATSPRERPLGGSSHRRGPGKPLDVPGTGFSPTRLTRNQGGARVLTIDARRPDPAQPLTAKQAHDMRMAAGHSNAAETHDEGHLEATKRWSEDGVPERIGLELDTGSEEWDRHAIRSRNIFSTREWCVISSPTFGIT